MKKYSKQRETILDVLRSTNTHPTAGWIYNKVREKLPNISLGTVYRNLSALTENGDILLINIGDGFDHFDGTTKPHLHLHCKECNSITDAFFTFDPIEPLAKQHGFKPKNSVYVVYGICEKCKKTN